MVAFFFELVMGLVVFLGLFLGSGLGFDLHALLGRADRDAAFGMMELTIWKLCAFLYAYNDNKIGVAVQSSNDSVLQA